MKTICIQAKRYKGVPICMDRLEIWWGWITWAVRPIAASQGEQQIPKTKAVFAIAFQHIYGKGVWSGAQIVRTGSVHLMGLCQFSIPDTCILRKVYQWNGDGDSRRNWWVRLDDTICCKASRSIKGTRRSCNFHKCTGISMLSVHRITLKSFFPVNASWKMKLQMKKAWETLLLSSCSKMCSQRGSIALLACKGGKSLKFLF